MASWSSALALGLAELTGYGLREMSDCFPKEDFLMTRDADDASSYESDC